MWSTERLTLIVKNNAMLFYRQRDRPERRSWSDDGPHTMSCGEDGPYHQSQKITGLDDTLDGHDC
jgi:hypothetical protein